MRILAFADLHGRNYLEAEELVRHHRPDWVVLLGDILPDFGQVSGRGNRLECQLNHWAAHQRKFVHPGAPTTFVRGNHEVEGFSVPDFMRKVPPSLQGRVMRLEGIPAEFGTFGWSREWEEAALTAELQRETNNQIQVVLSHVPPFGCLDEPEPATHIGHRPLRNWLETSAGEGTQLVLCGHVHESIGFAPCGKALVVNLATCYALLDDAEGAWHVERIEPMSSYSAQRRFLNDDSD